MINHPTTPPIAQTSRVMRLMGIGGETKRFVRSNSISPTMVLTARPTSHAVVRPSKTNTAATAMTTRMSTTHSMEDHYTRKLSSLDSQEKTKEQVASIHRIAEKGSSRKPKASVKYGKGRGFLLPLSRGRIALGGSPPSPPPTGFRSTRYPRASERNCPKSPNRP